MTYHLTARQAEVARLVAEGLQNVEIAEKLDCKPNTIRAHLAAIALRLPGRGNLRVRITVWAERNAA